METTDKQEKQIEYVFGVPLNYIKVKNLPETKITQFAKERAQSYATQKYEIQEKYRKEIEKLDDECSEKCQPLRQKENLWFEYLLRYNEIMHSDGKREVPESDPVYKILISLRQKLKYDDEKVGLGVILDKLKTRTMTESEYQDILSGKCEVRLPWCGHYFDFSSRINPTEGNESNLIKKIENEKNIKPNDSRFSKLISKLKGGSK